MATSIESPGRPKTAPLPTRGLFVLGRSDECSGTLNNAIETVHIAQTEDHQVRIASASCHRCGVPIAMEFGGRDQMPRARRCACGSPAAFVWRDTCEVGPFRFGWLGSSHTAGSPDLEKLTAVACTAWADAEPDFGWSRRLDASFLNVIENLADLPHFLKVHQSTSSPRLNTIEFHRRSFEVSSTHSIAFGPRLVPLEITATCIGGGLTVVQIDGPVQLTVVGGLLPLAPRKTYSFTAVRISSRRDIYRTIIGVPLAQELERQLLQDEVIWRSLCFVDKPLLPDGDPVLRVREWYQTELRASLG